MDFFYTIYLLGIQKENEGLLGFSTKISSSPAEGMHFFEVDLLEKGVHNFYFEKSNV